MVVVSGTLAYSGTFLPNLLWTHPLFRSLTRTQAKGPPCKLPTSVRGQGLVHGRWPVYWLLSRLPPGRSPRSDPKPPAPLSDFLETWALCTLPRAGDWSSSSQGPPRREVVPEHLCSSIVVPKIQDVPESCPGASWSGARQWEWAV